MPSPVDRYFEQIKKDNPSYSDEQAWATAWSIFCRHKSPGSEHCHKPPKEYLKGQGKKSMDKQAAITPNVEGFLLFLSGALTQYDQQQSTKRGYNPYALGQYLGTVQKIESDVSSLKHKEDPESLEALKKSISHRFFPDFPPAKKTLKAIDTFLQTGRPPKYPTPKRAFSEQGNKYMVPVIVIVRRVVARYLSAADYKEYVERKKKEGEKPLGRDEWEARVGDKDKGKDDSPKKKVEPLAEARDLRRAGGSAGASITNSLEKKMDAIRDGFRDWSSELKETSSDTKGDAKKYADKMRDSIKGGLDDAEESIQKAQLGIEKLFKVHKRELPRDIHEAGAKATKAIEDFDKAHKKFCDLIEKAFDTYSDYEDTDKMNEAHQEVWRKSIDIDRSLREMDETVMKYRDN